jgi:hypothetical protein
MVPESHIAYDDGGFGDVNAGAERRFAAEKGVELVG